MKSFIGKLIKKNSLIEKIGWFSLFLFPYHSRHYLPVGLNHFGNLVPVFDIAEEVMKLPEPSNCCFLFELLRSFVADSPSSDPLLGKLRPLKMEMNYKLFHLQH